MRDSTTTQPPAFSLHEEGGFTMVVLLIAVTVSSILMTVAATTWTHVSRRAAEAELIWRGEQYARGIQCYQQARGVPPRELEQILEAQCIRKLWEQPLSPDGSWEVIRAVAPGVAREALGDEERSGGLLSRGGSLLSRNRRSSEPIMGVAPGIDGEAITALRGSRQYEDWRFGAAMGPPPPVRALGVPPGQRQLPRPGGSRGR